jgi:flavin-dependent dehydrogenase
MEFDVIIAGAGLAGLTLARQLHQNIPGLSIALIDQRSSDIPKSAWKVGESSVEFGSHYLRDVLGLGEYLNDKHLAKLGLRFFFGDSRQPVSSRPELGLANPPVFVTYQLDRGILEADLRSHAKDQGITLLEEMPVVDICLGEEDTPHRVTCRDKNGEQADFTCRWLVDASGRRRLIQKKLNLTKPARGHSCSSAWFRLPGKVSVNDLVPAAETHWHDRVQNVDRYYSTNHFVGEGYWVWLIPLSGDATSVGIVCRDAIHPLSSYGTFEKALSWLDSHEPALAEYLAKYDPLDFRIMKDYSYTSKQIYSSDRWSCVGEAAVFSDPFYAPGLDFIGISNTFTTDLIKRDLAGSHNKTRIDVYSRYTTILNDQITEFNQHGYNYFTDEIVSACRILWDISAAWGYMCPQFFNDVLTDFDKQAALRKVTKTPYSIMAKKTYQILDQWLLARQQHTNRFSYDFFNYLDLPWLLEFRKGNLQKFEATEALCAQHEVNMDLFANLLVAIFLLAVEDIYPDDFKRIKDSDWFDIRELNLHPSQWDEAKMLISDGAAHQFRDIYSQIRGKFTVAQNPQAESKDAVNA